MGLRFTKGDQLHEHTDRDEGYCLPPLYRHDITVCSRDCS